MNTLYNLYRIINGIIIDVIRSIVEYFVLWVCLCCISR
jgi:hypothetical protein